MIFFTRGQCAIRHTGANFTDGEFHNIGTATEKDRGRYQVTQTGSRPGDLLTKPPSPRNRKGREPFLHDGRFQTLREVLDFYNQPTEAKLADCTQLPRSFPSFCAGN